MSTLSQFYIILLALLVLTSLGVVVYVAVREARKGEWGIPVGVVSVLLYGMVVWITG